MAHENVQVQLNSSGTVDSQLAAASALKAKVLVKWDNFDSTSGFLLRGRLL